MNRDGPKTAAAPTLTHLSSDGAARMVDVADKIETPRIAAAEVWLVFGFETWRALNDKTVPKGDVAAAARIAGIMAAKKTPDLIPLCHPLPISGVTVGVELLPLDALPDAVRICHPEPAGGLRIEAITRTTARTGVEMEALVAAGVAALTAYDMLKAVEKGVVITVLRLLQKSGGKSGDYLAPPLGG